ncbi:MAG: CpsD/CapB family tyrosine-protein kinase [Ferruginibacter sp.]
MVVGENKRTLIAEQFRDLRTHIKYITAHAGDRCKVILTTSSIPREGKSFVSINGAISLSLTGDRVVLIEFDLRKPKISGPLNITSHPGLSNYLAGSCAVEEIIKPHSSIKNLYIIPSGPIPPNPTELMIGDKLNQLFEYLKQHFDYIMIDSPPIAAVTDAKILSPFSDATIYIIRHNYTSKGFLSLLGDVYKKGNLKNINIVFNGIKNKRILGYEYAVSAYGYGYGYNYGYGYTSDEPKSVFSIKNWMRKLKKILLRR